MVSRTSYTWPVIIGIVAIVLLFVALPQSMKQWAPSFLQETRIHFGLDLAGGTQLDFRISEQEMREQIVTLDQQIDEAKAAEAGANAIAILENQRASIVEQHQNIVEAIRTVLERRINALGVSEAVITPSYVGSEKHLLVECPGVVDVQECIQTVGKTIKLEFKEEFSEATEEYEVEVANRVTTAQRRSTESGETLDVIGQDLSDVLGIAYQQRTLLFRDQMPEGLEYLWNSPAGDRIYRANATVIAQGTDSDGKPATQEIPGIFLVQVLAPATMTGRTITEADVALETLADENDTARFVSHEQDSLEDVPAEVAAGIRSMQAGTLRSVAVSDGSAHVLFLNQFFPGQEEMTASHILLSYQGATSAETTVTRTKEEAQQLSQELRDRIAAGENFESLARQYSDGPSGAQGGDLGTFTRDTMVPTFSAAAFSLQEGAVSSPVETAFGYHIIRADSAPLLTPDKASYQELVVTGENALGQAQTFIGQLESGEVQRTEAAITMRTLFFSLLPTGWKDTPLDGKHFRAATVTLDPTTNIPVVQISFNEEGGRLFQELTKRNIAKSIAIFVGGDLVSAPTVQGEITGGTAIITGMRNFDDAKQLAQELNTGAIPAPIYLAGQRTVEATLGAEALRTSLIAALMGIAILMIYMVLIYRLLGLLANVALTLYAFLFLAMLKMPLFLFSSQYIVLTLAGMAGIILSIGMAVDANVLIFERMKEELRKGKLLSTATETGFKRAWPSIRDGNVSTFITCIILFMVGTSVIRGFAITLGLGVALSMLSAITITRWMIGRIAKTSLAQNMALFCCGVPRNE